jgi:hypothetical protein
VTGGDGATVNRVIDSSRAVEAEHYGTALLFEDRESHRHMMRWRGVCNQGGDGGSGWLSAARVGMISVTDPTEEK